MTDKCNICPRKCGADRSINTGVCSVGDKIKIARAAPHFWEEPCISGTKGSGTVFFSGCNMKCIFCQNYEISSGGNGKVITPERLTEIYNELIEQGVHNINLVTPTHFSQQIIETLEKPLPVPVVYNSGGYDSVETLRTFEGKVQIYLPDMKYMSSALAEKYSKAKDYPEVAKNAIREMFRQTGEFEFDDNGIMQKGVVIRHLMLPGQLENTLDVIDWVSDEFGDKVIFSLMSQFTPNEKCTLPELQNTITQEEYNKAVDYMYLCGIENAYVQDFSSAKKEYTPPFDLSGV
ncbi:MAG: radical SAM protein [Clostridia bacterium]|nr:radical SAM protein [Clostridia bacterium]